MRGKWWVPGWGVGGAKRGEGGRRGGKGGGRRSGGRKRAGGDGEKGEGAFMRGRFFKFCIHPSSAAQIACQGTVQ